MLHVECHTCSKQAVFYKTDMFPGFVELVEEFLMVGIVASMADLHTTYLNVCKSNSIDSNETRLRSRKEVKKLLIEEIPGIAFSAAKQKNISE